MLMPAGRPTVFQPDLIKKVADCFFDGLTDAETALLCEIDEKTIRRARTGGFCPAIKKAEAARKQQYVRKLRDGLRQDWARIAWFLERRFPTVYAKPEIQLSFNNSYTQNNLSINISGQEAKQIESEAKPVRDAVSSMFAKYRPALGNGNGDDM